MRGLHAFALSAVLGGCTSIAGLTDLSFEAGGGGGPGGGSGGATTTATSTGGGGAGGAPASVPCGHNGVSWFRELQVTVSADLSEEVPIAIALSLDDADAPSSPEAFEVVAFADGVPVRRPRHVDVIGNDFRIWFRLPADVSAGAQPGELRLYACSAHEGAVGDEPTKVFTLWEPFDELDATRWKRDGDSGQVMDGQLQMGPQGTRTIHTFDTFGAGHAVDFLLRVVGPNNDTWWGYQVGNFVDQSPYMLWGIDQGLTAPGPLHKHPQTTQYVGAPVPLDDDFHWWSVERHATRTAFAYDGKVWDQEVWADAYLDGLPVRIDSDDGAAIVIEEARVRRVASMAPEVTLGPIERP